MGKKVSLATTSRQFLYDQVGTLQSQTTDEHRMEATQNFLPSIQNTGGQS